MLLPHLRSVIIESNWRWSGNKKAYLFRCINTENPRVLIAYEHNILHTI
jgi:hypothetical protein